LIPTLSFTGELPCPLPLKKDIQLSELDAWGTVADLGSEILEGEVKAFGK
jgi:hypothetical protein